MLKPSLRLCAGRSRLSIFVAFSLALLITEAGLQTSSAQAQAGERRWLQAGARTPLTGKRIALVVGNTHYGGPNALKNPENDARAMAHELESLGFEVLMCLDQTNKQMDGDIEEFGTKTAGAAVALFYFSGHGCQLDGQNFLIPVGFEGNSDSAIKYDAVNIGRVLDTMAEAKSSVNIIILDACRDNPFSRSARSMSSGLAYVNAPSGTFIAYATSPGNTAADNISGANGLYTQELLRQIKIPGLRIEDVFMNTRNAVLEASNYKQEPWEESSLRERFYFVPPLSENLSSANSLPAPVVHSTVNAQFKIPTTESIATPDSLRNTPFVVTISVRVTLKANGQILVDITKGSGYPVLDDQVKAVCSRIKFKPATQDGKAVDDVERFNFHLTNGAWLDEAANL